MTEQRREHERFSAVWSFNNATHTHEVTDLNAEGTQTTVEIQTCKTIVKFFENDVFLFEKERNRMHRTNAKIQFRGNHDW